MTTPPHLTTFSPTNKHPVDSGSEVNKASHWSIFIGTFVPVPGEQVW